MRLISISRAPSLRPIFQHQPHFVFKYLVKGMISKDLGFNERLVAVISNYSFMLKFFKSDFIEALMHDGHPVFEIDLQTNKIRIMLTISRPHAHEGELSLTYNINGSDAFVLSFTIVPGSLVNETTRYALLVSRMQGTKGHFPEISNATKALSEIAPPLALLSALQGIASALHIPVMAGISATNSRCYHPDFATTFTKDYDNFFRSIGAKQDDSGYFKTPLPLVDKPLSSIRRDHRSRTKAKRKVRQYIASQAQLAIYNGF